MGISPTGQGNFSLAPVPISRRDSCDSLRNQREVPVKDAKSRMSPTPASLTHNYLHRVMLASPARGTLRPESAEVVMLQGAAERSIPVKVREVWYW